MSRPKIFVSHSHHDADIVVRLKDWLARELLNAVDFFASSDSSSLPLGTEWYRVISDALETSTLAFVIASPRSIGSGWLFFEAGAARFRNIPVIPLCIRGVSPSDLPSPLNQFQAAEINTTEGQKTLVHLVAEKAGLTVPRRIRKLSITASSSPLLLQINDFFQVGLLNPVNHSQCIAEAVARLNDATLRPKEIHVSGASVTDIIHSATMSLASVAKSSQCERITIVIKSADLQWCSLTAKGMCFLPPYSSADSMDMIKQSRHDLTKLQGLCAGLPIVLDLRETSWPPTYTFFLIVYEGYSWGFIEPFTFGISISNRFAFRIFESNENAKKGIVAQLLESHSALLLDSTPI